MKQLFTEHWRFSKFPFRTDFEEAERRQDAFQEVELPHDWLIWDTASFDENSSGWYRKTFLCEKQEGFCYRLRFEGVYMDSELYVNGAKVMEWKYGYSTFEADITKQLVSGENVIMVGVHYQTPNSRWYSGAGIYRNVWLLTLPESHFASDGIYITAKEKEQGYQIRVTAQAVLPEDDAGREAFFCRCILNGEEKTAHFQPSDCLAGAPEAGVPAPDKAGRAPDKAEMAPDRAETAQVEFFLPNARVWDLEDPYQYEICCQLCAGDAVVSEETLRFGCRSVTVDPQRGLFLNHRKIKCNGVCLHHDLGALGAAVHKDAIRRQLCIMKEMGVNAVRTSHNMPAVELMELADEMGILIVSEAFDCWERCKTPYDYARFFDQWWKKDVASWVRRDRNHPSLLFWSIGNEIYDMHAGPRGQEITQMLMDEVYRHDPEKNGLVTFGSNYMPWENAQKCAEIVKIPGYNYAERYYDAHHEAHPDWVIYGSETSSTVQSRGVYHFPFKQSVLADVDEQCSALGNSTTSWGAKNSEACIIAERDHPYSLGQFLWSGFDYIGEPTPYHTKNSYFGQVDTAGFPKDSYYIYQAEWTDLRTRPILHLYPYWDFNEGQTIDVRICSNAPVVELFVNGRSQGKQAIDHEHGEKLTADYQVPYEAGEITAVAYDGHGAEIARETRHSFGDGVSTTLHVSDAEGREVPFSAEGDGIAIPVSRKQLLFLEIGRKDADGFPVENSNERVRVKVSGEGKLLGLDNGDSTDYEQYKGESRRLFGGKLLAILESTGKEGNIQVSVKTPDPGQEAAWVRKIELIRQGGSCLGREVQESEVAVRVLPVSAADQELKFDIITGAGICTDLAKVTEIVPASEKEREQGIVAVLRIRAAGDGEFRLRATAANGAPQARVISTLDYTAQGLGAMCFDPYRLVAGGLHNDSSGDITSGNEFGVSTSREDRTVIGFRGVDFGEIGSDIMTLPIFELDSERTSIGVWSGRPGTDEGRLIDTVIYDKPTIWNTYQEETYRLPERLKGICDLYFELHHKIHLKGFVFHKYLKAYERLSAGSSQRIYGDSLKMAGDAVMDIGNNVTLEFDDMDFGDRGCGSVRICGRTANAVNTIHIRFSSGEQEIRQAVEFTHAQETGEQEFSLTPVCGMQKVSFVFMPGSQFDFMWFQFFEEKSDEKTEA